MTPTKQLWILEDEVGCQFIYRETLESRYRLRIFSTLKEFVEALDGPEPDALIADVRLPDGSFLSFLPSAQWADHRSLPLIIVSSVDDTESLRSCFSYGARDYITKPFGKGELIVKIERLFEGQNGKSDFALNPTEMTVTRQGRSSVPLTTKEFQILALFEQSRDKPIPKKDILERVWSEVRVNPKTLDVHLFHLRQKLEPLGLKIVFQPPNRYLLTQVDLLPPAK